LTQTADDYTYHSIIVISSVTLANNSSPAYGTEAGGTTIKINGYNFVHSSLSRSVTLDLLNTPASCSVTSWTNTEITCVTTAHSAGLVSVTVDNGVEQDTYGATCALGTATACNGEIDNGEVFGSDRANVVEGFLYEEIFIQLALTTSDGTVDHDNSATTPNIPLVQFNCAPSAGECVDTALLEATTNNPNGYSLALLANSPNLVCSTNSAYQYTSVSLANGTTGSMSAGEWGWNWSSGTTITTPTVWRSLPTGTAYTFTTGLTATGTGQDGEDSDKYTIYYGAEADWVSTPANCTYKHDLQWVGTVVF